MSRATQRVSDAPAVWEDNQYKGFIDSLIREAIEDLKLDDTPEVCAAAESLAQLDGRIMLLDYKALAEVDRLVDANASESAIKTATETAMFSCGFNLAELERLERDLKAVWGRRERLVFKLLNAIRHSFSNRLIKILAERDRGHGA